MTEEESNKRQKTTDMKRVLIFGGKTGWIGQMMAELVKKEGTYTWLLDLYEHSETSICLI